MSDGPDKQQPSDSSYESTYLGRDDAERTRTHDGDGPDLTERIGPYRLLELLGEGGMGTVFLAEQREPVQRRVALKIIKAGMDTGQVIARFEAERQALAMMDHANIAKVLDAGATETGQPYFVMELVKGQPITEFCNKHRLSIHERLRLFASVCSAVQHAHQKGIIHRDLKPSNIVVERQGDQSVAKVIDFGLAKATGQQLTDKTLFTMLGQMVGTPAYMSPEQASGSADIDARTDVYSLGVVLYELLAGEPPIDVTELRAAGRDEILRIICEQDPPRMSTRLSSLGEDSGSRADERDMDVRHLVHALKGDLDVVVMKAMEKDRDRRYVTPSSLADDISRYLREEPIEARPPSASYLVSKFVRRNKATVVAASMVLLAVVSGAVFSGWQAVRATRARNAEARERGKSERALKNEKVANEIAGKRLEQLEGINSILASVFRDLDLEEEQQGGRPLRAQLGDRLDEATSMIDDDSIGDPLMVSNLRFTLGNAQRKLGRYDAARDLAEQALQQREAELGARHPETLRAARLLALVESAAGNYTAAVERLETVHRDFVSVLGEKHEDSLQTKSKLAANYGLAGDARKALALQQETYAEAEAAFGPADRRTIDFLRSLSQERWNSVFSDADAQEAERLAGEAHRRISDFYGEDHHRTTRAAVDLAVRQVYNGKYESAIALLEPALDRAKETAGADHLFAISVAGNLAGAYIAAGRTSEGVPLLQDVANRRKRKQGEDHPTTWYSMHMLAYGYEKAGRADEAIPIYTEIWELRKTHLGADHPETLSSLSNLAYCYMKNDQSAESVEHYRIAVEGMQQKLGLVDMTLGCMNNFGLALLDNEDHAEAETVFAASLEVQQRKYPEEWATFRTQARLGRALLKQRKYAEAEAALLSGYEGMKPHEEEVISGGFARCMAALIQLYQERGAPGDAEKATEWKQTLKLADSPPADDPPPADENPGSESDR